MLDIFNGNAFAVTTMTDAINEIQFVPGRIGELGLFQTQSVDTTSIAIERKGDILVLVPPTPRGGPGTTIAKKQADLRSLIVPHFEINDAVYADEVQNVRAFGTQRQLETVIRKVAQRQKTHVNSMAVTEEFARMGAVQGVVVYQDGSQLDLYHEFGVQKPAVLDLKIDASGAKDGDLRRAATGIIRYIQDALGGVPFAGVHAFVGDEFFDDLLQAKEVRETYKGWDQAEILRKSYIGANRSSYGIFEFGGIVWENYRGAVGSTTAIAPGAAHFFPTGVDGLFKSVYAPADYEETVNTMGERLYAKQFPMPNGKGRQLDTQMNALQYCTRPAALLQAKAK